jgi:hypothetical protein
MADHVRKQIRDAVVTALTGLTTTGANVFASRVYPLQATELPALRVYAQSESVEPMTIHAPDVLERLLRVQIESVCKANEDLDDLLDQICKEVEVALAWPVTGLASLAKGAALTTVEIEMAGGAEQPVGVCRMLYDVSYYTNVNAPDVAL